MDQKSTGTSSDKSSAKTSKREMGKPNTKRAKQTWSIKRQVETPVGHISGNCGRDGGAMERVRIVFASDCKPCPDCGEPFCVVCKQHYSDCECPGPSNAEDDGWKLVEENGILYGIRPVTI